MMKTPMKRREEIMKMFNDEYVKWCENTFREIIDKGHEKWTNGYTLSYSDKIEQLDTLIEYFESCEEYEKCDYILEIKNNIDRYIL